MGRRVVAIGAALAAGVAGLGFALVSVATAASASTTIDVRGSWAQVATTQGANYPQTVTWTTENFSSGALTGTDVGGGATFTETGTLNGSKITTHLSEVGADYTSDSVGTIKTVGGKLTWSGTFTDSAGHPAGTFTSTFVGPAGASSASPAASGLGPIPPACSTTVTSNCSYNSRDGALTFTPSAALVGDTIVAKMVSPAGVGNSWSWTNLAGLTAQNCAPSAVTCNYQATTVTGTPGARYVLGTIPGGSVQGPWTSSQPYAVADASEIKGGSGTTGKFLDVRGLWDGYYVQPGGATYHNPVDILTENFSTGVLTGTDDGTDGDATVSLTISGRTISGTIDQPSSNYSAQVSWTLSADGTELIAGGITDPKAPGAFVLFHNGGPVGAVSPLTSGAGVTKGPAPINALPTPFEAFSSPGRIVASAAISIAALLFITFPANLFNKTFEENYDVITAWWEPRLRRFRRKRSSTSADAEGPAAAEPIADSAAQAADGAAAATATAATKDDRVKFWLVVVAGAIFGGLLNPKFGANSASVNSFVATLLSVIVGTAVGTAVGLLYRRRKKYDVTRHFEALPAGLAIAALCVVLSRISDFQPGYLYGVVCGVAFAGTLAKNESGHLVALGHLATIAVAVIAWFAWVPVNHAALHHPGVFPLVILDDLLASLFVGGLVGSVINLIPVRFMPGHTLASWHRGAWMAVFGVATFGMVEIVLFPSRHNHAGHAPIITIIVLFVLFGGGSLVFREYFSRRERRLELAKSAGTEPAAEPVPVPTPRAEPTAELAPPTQPLDLASAPQNGDPTAEIHRL
jgi:polyisoprenoid-binding protein YceI